MGISPRQLMDRGEKLSIDIVDLVGPIAPVFKTLRSLTCAVGIVPFLGLDNRRDAFDAPGYSRALLFGVRHDSGQSGGHVPGDFFQRQLHAGNILERLRNPSLPIW